MSRSRSINTGVRTASQEILADYQAILDEANRLMPEDILNFGSLDRIVVEAAARTIGSLIRRSPMPKHRRWMAAGRGRCGSTCGSRDNVYRWGMRTLAYHEGIPGHIFQMAQAQKIKRPADLPKSHYFFNAYIEGWALYAERLAWETGAG